MSLSLQSELPPPQLSSSTKSTLTHSNARELGALFISIKLNQLNSNDKPTHVVRYTEQWMQLLMLSTRSKSISQGQQVFQVSRFLSSNDHSKNWLLTRVHSVDGGQLVVILLHNHCILESKWLIFDLARDMIQSKGTVVGKCASVHSCRTGADGLGVLIALGSSNGQLWTFHCSSTTASTQSEELRCSSSSITALFLHAPSGRQPLIFAGDKSGHVCVVGYHNKTGLAKISKSVTSTQAPVTQLEFNGEILIVGHGSIGTSFKHSPSVSALTMIHLGDRGKCSLKVLNNVAAQESSFGRVSCMCLLQNNVIVVFNSVSNDENSLEISLLEARKDGLELKSRDTMLTFPFAIMDAKILSHDRTLLASFNATSIYSSKEHTTDDPQVPVLSLEDVEPWFKVSAPTHIFSEESVTQEIIDARLKLDGELFIDKLFAFANVSADAYPPRSNKEYRYLIQCTLDSALDIMKKHAILYYILRQDKSGRHLQYAKHFTMPKHLCAALDGYHCMDHLKFQEAMYFFCDPQVQLDWPQKILNDLYTHQEYKAALFFLHRLSPEVNDTKDKAIKMDLLAESSVHEAMEYQRVNGGGDLFKCLLGRTFADSPGRPARMAVLMRLPLTSSEENYLMSYCSQSLHTWCHDFLVLFYKSRNRRVQMVQAFEQFSAGNQLTESSKHKLSMIVDSVKCCLTAVEKKAVNCWKADQNSNAPVKPVAISLAEYSGDDLTSTLIQESRSRFAPLSITSSEGDVNDDALVDGSAMDAFESKGDATTKPFSLDVPEASYNEENSDLPNVPSFFSPQKHPRGSALSSKNSSNAPSPLTIENNSPFSPPRRKSAIRSASKLSASTSSSQSPVQMMSEETAKETPGRSWLSNPLAAITSFWTPVKKPVAPRRPAQFVTFTQKSPAKRAKIGEPTSSVEPGPSRPLYPRLGSNSSPKSVHFEEPDDTDETVDVEVSQDSNETATEVVAVPPLLILQTEANESIDDEDIEENQVVEDTDVLLEDTEIHAEDIDEQSEIEKRSRTASSESFKNAAETGRIKKIRAEHISPSQKSVADSPQLLSSPAQSRSLHSDDEESSHSRSMSPTQLFLSANVSHGLRRSDRSPTPRIASSSDSSTEPRSRSQTPVERYKSVTPTELERVKYVVEVTASPRLSKACKPTRSKVVKEDVESVTTPRYNLRHPPASAPMRLTDMTLEQMNAAIASPRRRPKAKPLGSKSSSASLSQSAHVSKTSLKPVAMSTPVRHMTKEEDAHNLVRVTRSISRNFHVSPSQDVTVEEIHSSQPTSETE